MKRKPGTLGQITIRLSIGVLLALLAGIATLLFGVFPQYRDIITFGAAAAGAAITLFGGYYAALAYTTKLDQDKASHSFRLLEGTNTKEFTDALVYVHGLESDAQSDATKYENLIKNQQTLTSIKLMLNFLEDIAIAIKQDFVDEDVIYLSLGTVIPNAFNRLKFFIDRERERYDDKRVYEELEYLVDSWKPRKK